jgi:hypothetical protein
MSGKQIIFVERASDAAAAARLAGEQGDSTIIALNSSVIWALDKQGVEHRIGLDYYDVSELHALKEDLYPRTEEICEVINDVLPSCCGTLGADQIEWAKSIFHPIKCLLNTVTQQLLHVARAIRTERPDQVTVFTPGPEKPLSELNLDPASINLWHKLIGAIAHCDGIALNVVSDATGLSVGLGRFSRRLGARLQRARTLCGKVRRRLKRCISPTVLVDDGSVEPLDLKSPMRVLFLKPRYSHGLAADYMKARDIGEAISFEAAAADTDCGAIDLSGEIQTLWDRLRTDERFADLMTFEGLNIAIIVERYLQYLLARGLTTAYETYNKARAVLAGRTVDAAVMTTVTYPDDWAVALACRQANIPVITWQHGSYAMFEPHTQPAYYDVRYADYFFAFGEGTRRAFEDHAARWNTEVVPVGSAVLDRLRGDPISRAGASDASPRTVLVPLRGLNIRVLGDSYQTYPLDVYWRELTKMLEVLAKFDELRFILKLYPTNTPHDNPISDFLKTRGIGNVRIEYIRGFTEVLPEANMVLLDWPYSTLLEAACTDLPIVCYKRHWPLRCGVGDMIAKRCFLTDDPDELEAILEKYRSGELPVLTDRTLLGQYGNQGDDGGSIRRGIRQLDKIIKRSHADSK